MDKVYENLTTLITNAKKSLSKTYTKETIQEKRNEIERLGKTAIKILNESNLTTQDKQAHIDKFGEFRKDALQILKLHEDKLEQSSSTEIPHRLENSTSTMENESLNANELASVSKLITNFSGTKEELNSFIANIEILRDTFPTNKHDSFFNFVYKTKLTPKVQNRIRQIQVPTCINTLITTLKEAYKPKKSPNVILNELTRIVQTDSIRKFADKIEQLTLELNEIQIGTLGEQNREVISETNAVIAFNSFKNGLKNKEITRTIEASRVKKLSEAIEIATEVSTDIRQNQVLFQSAQQSNNSRNYRNNNNYNNNNYRNRYRNNNNNRLNNNGHNGNSYNNRTNRDNVNNTNRNNYRRNNNDRNSNNNYNNNRNGNNNNSNNYNRNNNRNNNNNYRNNNRGQNAYHVQNQGNESYPEVSYQQTSPDQNE